MLGDITIYQQPSAQGGRGSRRFNVAPSSVIINPGEPVTLLAGSSTVIVGVNNLITVPSPFVPYSVSGTGLVGIAETTSTNTSTLAGYVDIVPATSNTTFIASASSVVTITTQAQYDALVGHRVLLDLSGGKYTVLGTDSALNGLVIMPLDIFKAPGKIAFAFVDGVSALM